MDHPITSGEARRQKPVLGGLDFSQIPFIVIWEVTRACNLKCFHCRAAAQPHRHPQELTTEEGKRLLDSIREFGTPLLVLTGGDPIKRPDIYELIRYADELGLRVAMTPSATKLVTPDAIARCRDAGLVRMAISLDGATDQSHDALRRVPGSFARTLDILRWCQDLGLSRQINTTITRLNIDEIDDLIALLEDISIALWSVFFLVPTGRGRGEDEVSASEYEAVFEKMYELSKTCSFDIKSTAAPHYRRVILQHQVAEERAARGEAAPTPAAGATPKFLTRGTGFSLGDGVGRSAQGVNDGNGFVFVSHVGDVCPNGLLPVSGGNVRTQSLVDIYRHSDLFTRIRDYAQLKGKCRVCEYRNICGGSRARAYAMLGDYMECEPLCIYVPDEWQHMVERGEAEPPGAYVARRLQNPALAHLVN